MSLISPRRMHAVTHEDHMCHPTRQGNSFLHLHPNAHFCEFLIQARSVCPLADEQDAAHKTAQCMECVTSSHACIHTKQTATLSPAHLPPLPWSRPSLPCPHCCSCRQSQWPVLPPGYLQGTKAGGGRRVSNCLCMCVCVLAGTTVLHCTALHCTALLRSPHDPPVAIHVSVSAS